jgi:hypothetical protein
MKLSHVRNRKNIETRNSSDLTELSAGLTELSDDFFKKIGHFKKTILTH